MSDTHSTLRLLGLFEMPEPTDESSSGMATMVTIIPMTAGGTAASRMIATAFEYEVSSPGSLSTPANFERRRAFLLAKHIRVEIEQVTMRFTRTEEPADRTIIAGDGMILPWPKSMFQGFTGSRAVL